jgi:hypothetical protein
MPSGVRSIGGISTVLLDFHKNLFIAEPNLKHIVLSPHLDYIDMLQALRRKLKVKNDLQGRSVIAGSMPFMAYNRNMLVVSDVLKEKSRFRGKSGTVNDDGTIQTYKVVYGSILIRFMYVTNNIRQLEDFELAFTANESFRKLLRFESNLGEEGSYEYQVYWDNLTDFYMSEIHDGSVKNSVSGLAKIVGWFFVSPPEVTRRIETIDVSIEYPEDTVLTNFTVS